MMECGNWSHYRALTREDLLVFKEAMKCYTGAKFEPVLVATQSVAGTNYQYICNTFSCCHPSKNYISKVTIFQPLFCACDNRPSVTDVCEMCC